MKTNTQTTELFTPGEWYQQSRQLIRSDNKEDQQWKHKNMAISHQLDLKK